MSSTSILFLTNNEQSLELYNWLKSQPDTKCVLFQEKINSQVLESFMPDLVICYGYRYIIREEIITKLNRKIINLHISYLPWNKGAHPNLWSFLENTTKGVTIHLIDKGIDTGAILYQEKVNIDEKNETLASSYKLLQYRIQELFKQKWESIKKLEFTAIEQKEKGSIHYKKDFEKIAFLLQEKGWDIPISELKQKYQEYLLTNEDK